MRPNLLITFFLFVLFCLARLNGGEGPQPPAAGSSETNGLFDKVKAANAIGTDRDRYFQDHGGVEDETFHQYNLKFARALQEAAGAFPIVEPPLKSATNHFAKFTFNERGIGLDGFRFKNNSTEARNFGWVFAYDSPTGISWFIVPTEGESAGFTEYWEQSGPYAEEPWKSATNKFEVIVQSLTGGKILPGKEYIIWLKFKDDKPKDIYIAFDLFPPEVPLNYHVQVEHALGLK
jgi:hypothetical protein